MHEFKLVTLESIALTAELEQVLDEYKKLYSISAPNQLRIADYQRLSFVQRLITSRLERFSLLDIGVGAGQFLNAVAQMNEVSSVDGLDLYKNTKFVALRDRITMTYKDVASFSPNLQWDVVTCMECLEHLPDDKLTLALDNIRSVARRLLVITVPFNEQKLPSYHLQRFTPERLVEMFPKAEIWAMSKKATIHWVAIIEEIG